MGKILQECYASFLCSKVKMKELKLADQLILLYLILFYKIFLPFWYDIFKRFYLKSFIKIGSFILRQQVLTDFPPKELRSIVDQSKKDIKEGIVVSFSTFEGKVGVAVGITNKLTKKYDAVALVKIASEVLGGKGGGGRKDFAQAGGSNKDKIEDALKALSDKIT